MPSTNIIMKASLAFVVVAATCSRSATAAPIPNANNEVASSFTGAGGSAPGGSVLSSSGPATGLLGGMELVSLGSNNAGKGGIASSGNAGNGNAASSSLTNLIGSNSDGSDAAGSFPAGTNDVGSSFTGVGGDATGGDVTKTGGALIDLFSGNAGSGGKANSGSTGMLVPIYKKPVGSRISRVIHVRID